ncbi:MAG: DUF92 domain-containing protein, partial [Sciscionella sp.]
RSLAHWRIVPPGTSGAVTLIGSLGACAGALLIAGAASVLAWHGAALAVCAGGIAGAIADSVIGATGQGRRWCDACERETERTTHDCGTATRPFRGWQWLDNDVVNLLSGATGGIVALLLVR